MHPERISDPEIREIGGEPLEGSGFETESPTSAFDIDELPVREGFDQ